MTREGEPYDCKVCGGEHKIKVDEKGMPSAFGFIEYYVDCPEYGAIVWTDSA
jgi:hypothetical protein